MPSSGYPVVVVVSAERAQFERSTTFETDAKDDVSVVDRQRQIVAVVFVERPEQERIRPERAHLHTHAEHLVVVPVHLRHADVTTSVEPVAVADDCDAWNHVAPVTVVAVEMTEVEHSDGLLVVRDVTDATAE